MLIKDAYKLLKLNVGSTILIKRHAITYNIAPTYAIGTIHKVTLDTICIATIEAKGDWSFLKGQPFSHFNVRSRNYYIKFLDSTKALQVVAPIIHNLYKCVDIDTNKKFILKSSNEYKKLAIVTSDGYWLNKLFIEKAMHTIHN